MCGIVGSFIFSDTVHNIPVTEAHILQMRDTMIHRGPDSGGVWLSQDGKLGLGHRRLSILDLTESAAQPMSNEDGTVWVVFNGEIYNHAQIRAELEQLGGHRWKTDHSDTEVILHAFEEWGIDCLHKFRGMFAIALWDDTAKELWLIRDRIGVKPLYYSIHHGRITFASEIKALLQAPGQQRAVNEEGFYHYLSFLTTPAPLTLFKGIQKLPAATWLRISAAGQVREHRYWDVWDHTTPLTEVSETDITEQLRSELCTAVELRKVSDVPVGVFLSGGIDSSTNVALFSQGEEQPLKTFSIGYQGEYTSYTNELEYARQMADFVGAEYHERLLTIDDMLDFLPRMVYLQDEPIADPVCMPVYYVSKLARDYGVTVCQVGEGSDELFWGYPGWKTALKAQHLLRWPVPTPLKQMGLAALRGLGKQHTFRYEWLHRATLGLPIFWGGAEAFTEGQKQQLLSPRLRQQFANVTSWDRLDPIYRQFKEKAWETSDLNWMSYLDLNLRLPELLLMRVDKMSMGVSLEGRVPFLDHKFVELAMSIPESVKTREGTLKYILKQATRGLIPNPLIDRQKQGFGVPVYEWFLDRLGQYAIQELKSFCQKTDFLDWSYVTELIRDRRGQQIWYLLNFTLWWNCFFDD